MSESESRLFLLHTSRYHPVYMNTQAAFLHAVEQAEKGDRVVFLCLEKGKHWIHRQSLRFGARALLGSSLFCFHEFAGLARGGASLLRQVVDGHGASLVVIDHLGHLRTEGDEPADCRTLKKIWKALEGTGADVLVVHDVGVEAAMRLLDGFPGLVMEVENPDSSSWISLPPREALRTHEVSVR